MSTSEYPNRDTLRKANDIYLDVMRSFITHNLKQVKGEKVEHLVEYALSNYDNQIDKFLQMLDEYKDVESAIDFNYIPHIIKYHWNKFEQKFDGDLVAQNMIWLIRKGRNSCEHIGKNDLDYEFTRTHLYLIACILEYINRSDKQDEIKKLRDQFLSDDASKKISELTESYLSIEEEKNKYKNDLAESNLQIENLKKEQTGYKIKINELKNVEKEIYENEERLTKIENEKNEFEEAWSESEEKLNSKTKQYEKLIAQEKKNNKQFKSLKKQVNNIKSQRDNAQKTLSSVENELETIKNEKKDTKDCLATMHNLLTSVTISNQFFPPLSIDSNVRILDRRNTDKQTYLIDLLKLNLPSIIYVNNEKKIDQFFNIVSSEVSDLIGKHTVQTSDEEENELLEKLRKNELLAIVSNSTLSSDTPLHSVEHIVLCHYILEQDVFFRRCQPAFTSNHNTYIHLIYDNKPDIEKLTIYPDQDTLRELYLELKPLIGIKEDFVKPDQYFLESGSVKPEYETGFAIFEELYLLERNEEGIKLLPSDRKRDLDESVSYREGIKQNLEINEFMDLQLYQPVEIVWEKIVGRMEVEDVQGSITPTSAIVWSEKTLSAVAALRMRVRKDYPRENGNSRNRSVISPHEHGDQLSNAILNQLKLKLSVSEENDNYMNEYHLAIQFVEKHGIRALQHCVVQLNIDKYDPDYEFTYMEKKMLCAFQMFLQDFKSQSEESDQVRKTDIVNTIKNTQENEIAESKKKQTDHGLWLLWQQHNITENEL